MRKPILAIAAIAISSVAVPASAQSVGDLLGLRRISATIRACRMQTVKLEGATIEQVETAAAQAAIAGGATEAAARAALLAAHPGITDRQAEGIDFVAASALADGSWTAEIDGS